MKITGFSIITLLILFTLFACNQNKHRILYQSDSTFWLLAPDQGSKSKLFEPAPDVFGLSGDLAQVALTTDGSDLWITDPNWENQRRLSVDQIPSSELEISKVVWSPDSKAIALWSIPIEEPRANPEKFELDVIQLDDQRVQKSRLE